MLAFLVGAFKISQLTVFISNTVYNGLTPSDESFGVRVV